MIKAVWQPGREVGVIVVHCTEVDNLASSECCGLLRHTSLAASPPCWAGCSAEPAEMDAGAILSEGSIRQEAPTDTKCGVGLKSAFLALGVEKEEMVRVAQDECHALSLRAWLCHKHSGAGGCPATAAG